jgi:hypothetical protein
MVTWVQAAPWLARLGGVVAVVGLFLTLGALGLIGLMLLSWGLVLGSIFWGLPRISTHPAWVACVGGGLALLGGLWTAWNVNLWVGGCPGVFDCLPVPDALLNTLLFGGPALCVAGAALFTLGAIRFRGARGAQIAPGPPSQTPR